MTEKNTNNVFSFALVNSLSSFVWWFFKCLMRFLLSWLAALVTHLLNSCMSHWRFYLWDFPVWTISKYWNFSEHWLTLHYLKSLLLHRSKNSTCINNDEDYNNSYFINLSILSRFLILSRHPYFEWLQLSNELLCLAVVGRSPFDCVNHFAWHIAME